MMVPPRRLIFWRSLRDPLLYLDFMLNSTTNLDPFGPFWCSFGLLLVPFRSLLVDLGSLLVSFLLHGAYVDSHKDAQMKTETKKHNAPKQQSAYNHQPTLNERACMFQSVL